MKYVFVKHWSKQHHMRQKVQAHRHQNLVNTLLDAKIITWLMIDTELRKCGEQMRLETSVAHTVNDECFTVQSSGDDLSK